MQNPTIVNGSKNADDFIFLLGNLPSYIIHRVIITTAAPAPLRRGGMIKRSRYCYYINWLFRTSRSTEFQTLSFLEVEHPSIHLSHILHSRSLSLTLLPWLMEALKSRFESVALLLSKTLGSRLSSDGKLFSGSIDRAKIQITISRHSCTALKGLPQFLRTMLDLGVLILVLCASWVPPHSRSFRLPL